MTEGARTPTQERKIIDKYFDGNPLAPLEAAAEMLGDTAPPGQVRTSPQTMPQLIALMAEMSEREKVVEQIRISHENGKWGPWSSLQACQAALREAYDAGSGELAALRKDLEQFKALDKYLPSGYAIGDDATATLAIELAERDVIVAALRKERDALKEALRNAREFLRRHDGWPYGFVASMKEILDRAESSGGARGD